MNISDMAAGNGRSPAHPFVGGGPGLTKREEFAKAAMVGILSSLPQTADYDAKETARIALEHADALLEELAK